MSIGLAPVTLYFRPKPRERDLGSSNKRVGLRPPRFPRHAQKIMDKIILREDPSELRCITRSRNMLVLSLIDDRHFEEWRSRSEALPRT